MEFTLSHTCPGSGARAGVIHTDHGDIPTPIFMPVGTAGTVKAVHQRELSGDLDAPVILANTYHLYLRPGTQTLEGAGGLHRFMGWDRPILTDSGGFQVFSLSAIRRLTSQGVQFRSHIDGSPHMFTPEGVVDIQRAIGSDIMMALDECPPGDCNRAYARRSLDLTMGWLRRGWDHFRATSPRYGHSQAFFPIVQGAAFADLRLEAAQRVADLGAEGNAIGGLAVGEPTEVMYSMIEVVNDVLPADRPRYLMGVGTPANILEAVDRGVDMMDCVMPTRNARNATLFTWRGVMNMRNRRWAQDYAPLDSQGTAWVDRDYSRAYLRHLFVADELLALQIASVHNLAFYLDLVRQARRHVIQGDFPAWKAAVLPRVSGKFEE